MMICALTFAAISALPSIAAQIRGLQQRAPEVKSVYGFRYEGQGYCEASNRHQYSYGSIPYGPRNSRGIQSFQEAVETCPFSPIGVQDEIDRNNVGPGGICVCLYDRASMTRIDFSVFSDYNTRLQGEGPVRGTTYVRDAQCYSSDDGPIPVPVPVPDPSKADIKVKTLQGFAHVFMGHCLDSRRNEYTSGKIKYDVRRGEKFENAAKDCPKNGLVGVIDECFTDCGNKGRGGVNYAVCIYNRNTVMSGLSTFNGGVFNGNGEGRVSDSDFSPRAQCYRYY